MFYSSNHPSCATSFQERSDDEDDILDRAFRLIDSNNLGCQVRVTEGMDSMQNRPPSATRNMFVDEKKPTNH
ncbi:hypothetical protein EDD17DRAFT_1594782 [Pisolithus thermaeus]|nr:hypothetical protein EV401DRAFT_1510377 [Pisolithus croceorrhizus]KAI6160920.1 hypothetical protein EDD17DRAFT_1594782 [Pisolithus thermaeus]